MTLKFDGWPRKAIGHLFCTTSSFVRHFKPIGEFKLELQSRNTRFGSTWRFAVLCDLEICWMTLKNNRVPFLCYFKLCKSLQSHWWIQTGVTVLKHSIRLKIRDICPLWPWNLTGDLKKRAPLLSYFKIWASFHHLWIQTGVTVRKIPIWVKINHFF